MNTPKEWPETIDIPVPTECLPCRYCGKRDELYAEAVEDWHDRGQVVRIGCLCDKSEAEWDKDWRTEFLPIADAVGQWNVMQYTGKLSGAGDGIELVESAR